jgi:hypothetical protein
MHESPKVVYLFVCYLFVYRAGLLVNVADSSAARGIFFARDEILSSSMPLQRTQLLI